MKWFKHDSSARNSEKIAALEHRTGIEGYGFYFKMLEIVAGLMDENDRCEAKFSPTSWARQTNISTKKWLFLAQCCSEVGLIELQCDADVVSVKIPKLLKRRDNHTKNLQVTKQVTDKKVSLDKDKEKDKEEEKNKGGRNAPISLPSSIPTEVWEMWDRYRNSKKGWTADAKKLNLRTLTEIASKGFDPRKVVETSIERGWTGLFEPKADQVQKASTDYRRPAL
jgi:hypothetical protein